jgi:glycosyltransferase involved in cell wall biosynthesis
MYGPGGGVLTVVHHLAEQLAERHDVELVSVLRTADEPVHPVPAHVSLRSLADIRDGDRSAAVAGQVHPDGSNEPSRLIPRDAPHYRHFSRRSDAALRRFLKSVDDGALVGMQPGVAVAIARLGRASTLRIAQDHRPFITRKKQLRQAMRRHFPNGLDMLLTLTETDAGRYRALFDGPPPVRVMPNATPRYNGPLSDHTHNVVLAAGHLTYDKGFDRLIEAWALIHQRNPDWELHIYGEGRREAELRQQISELGLDRSVHLMGYTTSLRHKMASSSLFVLSSRVEGFGLVLLEAMACGVPVVSFDCPTGPRDIITSGHDGVLVPNGDIRSMAESIDAMMRSRDRRMQMGAAAAQTAGARSQAQLASRWERLFAELMDARPQRSARP